MFDISILHSLFETRRSSVRLFACIFPLALFATGCAHYPLNERLKEVDSGSGYRTQQINALRSSDELILFITFSGGGTRASAFSYGVLEELEKTEITLQGRKRSLLDEVDIISGVSGGSFTAAYYGLSGIGDVVRNLLLQSPVTAVT